MIRTALFKLNGGKSGVNTSSFKSREFRKAQSCEIHTMTHYTGASSTITEGLLLIAPLLASHMNPLWAITESE